MGRPGRSSIIIDDHLERKYWGQLMEIDRLAYSKEPNPAEMEWAEKRPEMYTVLRRGEKVFGYGLVIKMKSTAMKAMKKAELWEDGIGLDCIANRSPLGYYVASIATLPGSTERERAITVGATVGQILKAPEEVIAIPVSESGDRICRMIRMEPLWSSLVLKGMNGYRPTLYSSRKNVPCERKQ
ncbi:MAG: hypothetical protein JW754_04960 [Candidatus Aenigmarchaeota archaeon]|nr:hypothetical protein [Candidatus Aenigmarchaeota archaeon]